MKEAISISENKPYTVFPSDTLGYFHEDGTQVQISDPALRYYPFLKVVHNIYKPKYRFFGRFTVYVSMDKKHWIKRIDQILPRRR